MQASFLVQVDDEETAAALCDRMDLSVTAVVQEHRDPDGDEFRNLRTVYVVIDP